MIGIFFRRAWRRATAWLRPSPKPFSLAYVEGDELPEVIPERTLIVARENGDLWSAGMICPCGCGRRIELMLLPDVKPRWSLHVNKDGRPGLSPSVWVTKGCRSHFWLRNGEVHWSRN